MVSAQHGRGAGDLLDHIVDRLEEATPSPEVDENDDGALRVAIVGRPNVGKSTLFNQLIGEERSVVHDMPGTTRDAIDTVVDTSAGLIRFIDTAGMRKRARTEAGLETYSVLRSLDALDAPTSPFSSSTPSKAPPGRISGWPSASQPQAVPRSSFSISGSWCPLTCATRSWRRSATSWRS